MPNITIQRVEYLLGYATPSSAGRFWSNFYTPAMLPPYPLRTKKTFILFGLLCCEPCQLSAVSSISFLSISSPFVRLPAEMRGRILLSTSLLPCLLSSTVHWISGQLNSEAQCRHPSTGVSLWPWKQLETHCTALPYTKLLSTAMHFTALDWAK